MRSTVRRPVVIGVDRSAESQLALRWGVDEAIRRGLDARLVSVYPASHVSPVMIGLDVVDVDAASATETQRVLDKAVAYASDRLGGDRVTGTCLSGLPARELLAEGTDAELLVVGSRVRGTVWSVVMGSVSCAVAAHATCPVAVVRSFDGEGTKPILVGIDGSPSAEQALHFAFEEADLREVPLDVAHCWQQMDHIDPAVWLQTTTQEIRGQLSDWLGSTVAAVQEKYPRVVVRQHLLEGSAGLELTAKAKDAGLVVVGSRGHGGVAGLLVGSVSQNLLHHAPCTVVVVR